MNEAAGRQVALAWADSVLDMAEFLATAGERVYLAGGAVRDAVLRRPVHDLDLVCSGGRRLARRIADHWHGDYYSLDDARDVGRALIDTADGRLVVDVARMRGDSLDDDLRERDFTVNAMGVQLNGELDRVFDPTGGLADLTAKRLRQCSEQAIASDPIRALRAVRMSVQFGLRIEAGTLAAVRAHAELLTRPSPERVRDEFFAILGLPKPAAALRVAWSLGLIVPVLPQWAELPALLRDRTLLTVERTGELLRVIGPQRTDDTAAQFALGMAVMALDRYRGQLNTTLAQELSMGRARRGLLIFAAMLSAFGPAQAAEMGRVLRLSRAECDWLELTLAALPGALELREPDELAMHRYWRAAGSAGIDGLLLALAATLAAQGAALDQDGWVRQLEAARLLLWAWFDRRSEVVEPAPLVTGAQLMKALRLKSGPQIGALLDALREAQVMGQVTTETEALELAAEILAGGQGGP
ncbi:MAG: CCA tRNA nucleotidyltransferase [Anaerolineae bacterium]|nr:CCA tRNA nucleotidyltransferase [Anaerolineae bacterium]